MKTISVVSLRHGVKSIFIDDEDWGLASKYRWHIQENPIGSGKFYAATNAYVGKKRTILRLHSLLMPEIILVDHIDGNGLNNIRSNLRLADKSGNAINSKIYRNNTSGYRGVSLNKKTGNWYARIVLDGKVTTLGTRSTSKEAYALYKAAANNLHKEYQRISICDNGQISQPAKNWPCVKCKSKTQRHWRVLPARMSGSRKSSS